ncbi:hypothetical protein PS1_038132 [Malus domestica]
MSPAPMRQWRWKSQKEKPSCVFAKGVTISRDGKDAWVFNIDETLLSNFPYYQAYGFISETFDEASFDGWVELAEAPALPASLNLYSQLERLQPFGDVAAEMTF